MGITWLRAFHSSQYHFDELQTFLSDIPINFQIIGITETRIKKNYSITTNIQLPDYTIEHTPTESANGGALLYIKNNLNYKLRPDLQIYKKKELETVFIEILQENKENVIVGCIYRHPCMSPQEFNDFYLKNLTEKLRSENKEVILLGDFNIDLMKYETNKTVSDFLDNIYSSNLLPSITTPTRITPRSQTLIDNIFCSIISDNYESGNLLSTFSDHLGQFLILPSWENTDSN